VRIELTHMKWKQGTMPEKIHIQLQLYSTQHIKRDLILSQELKKGNFCIAKNDIFLWIGSGTNLRMGKKLKPGDHKERCRLS
jgi:hypothetical protein